MNDETEMELRDAIWKMEQRLVRAEQSINELRSHAETALTELAAMRRTPPANSRAEILETRDFLIAQVLMRLKWPRPGAGRSRLSDYEREQIEEWYNELHGGPGALSERVEQWRTMIANFTERAMLKRKAEQNRRHEQERAERAQIAAERRKDLVE